MATNDIDPVVAKWQKRFKLAYDFKKPITDKFVRMYQLFRGYDYRTDYAYQIQRMPPIAFKLIETFVSRLAPAKREVQIIPRMSDDTESPSLARWDDLLQYIFDVSDFEASIKTDLVQDSGMFGKGLAKVVWAGKLPGIILCDPMDILPAPETKRMRRCPWLIHRIVKNYDTLKREEDARGADHLYDNLDQVSPSKVDDWKKPMYELDSLKMGQIETMKNKTQKPATYQGYRLSDMYEGNEVEIWECYDWETDPQQLVVIMQQKVKAREETNPFDFLKSSGGRNFIEMDDHRIARHFWSVGHIEPVENLILDVADFQNHRSEVASYMTDPVVKIRKDTGITKRDIVFAPMAIWELRKLDDVEVVPPPSPNLASKEIEMSIRDEIEQTLAMTEYMSGQPQSSNEAMGKVEMLISQSNQRLSINTENIEAFYTDLSNILIEMCQELLDEDVYYRIMGKDGASFGQFTSADAKVAVDAIVKIEPIIPPSKKDRISAVMFLLDNMVGKDQPDPQDPEAMQQWKMRKRILFEMLLKELDKEQYIDQFLGTMPADKAVPISPPLAVSGAPVATPNTVPGNIPPQQAPMPQPTPQPQGQPMQAPQGQRPVPPNQQMIPIIPKPIAGQAPQGAGTKQAKISKLRQMMQKIPLIQNLA